MLFWQLFLYCLFFTAMVKLAVGNSAVNGLFFYPQAVQERAFALGLSDRETVRRRFRRFMAAFYLVMPAALLGIVGGWNGIRDFGGAYRQSLLFLEVMNVYDGVVIDKLWVGRSPFWKLPGIDLPYAQTWPQMLRKRLVLSLIWAVGAVIPGGLALLF